MQQAKGQKFEGLSGMLKQSPWLAGEDLNGLGDVEVEIEDVLLYEAIAFDAGRVEKNKPTLRFKGKKKEMVLNTVNRKHLAKMFSTDTKKWRGQKITLYYDPTVKMKGEAVGGIRIR